MRGSGGNGGCPDARRRRDEVAGEPMVVVAAGAEDEFWALIAHDANPVPNQEAAHRLMTWIRSASPRTGAARAKPEIWAAPRFPDS